MDGPQFIDNREGNTFAKSIHNHLKSLRESGKSPEELCIGTGHFNAAGWLQVAITPKDHEYHLTEKQ